MVSSQMAALLVPLGQDGENGLAAASAAACAAVIGVSGIGATAFPRTSGGALVWHSGAASVGLDALQFQLGQGPSVDAVATGDLVMAPDLSDAATARWSAFTPVALELGVQAAFAFPLRIGAISLGSMLAYRASAGPLGAGAMDDALALAEAAALALLAPPRGGADVGSWLQRPSAYRAEGHQATGMVSVQLDVDLADALVRLRAHAFSQGLSVDEVAADVVARRLRFSADMS